MLAIMGVEKRREMGPEPLRCMYHDGGTVESSEPMKAQRKEPSCTMTTSTSSKANDLGSESSAVQ